MRFFGLNIMIKSFILAFTLLFGFIGATHAQSHPLAKCVTENITGKDRTTLVRWLFTMMGAHQQLTGLSLTSKESIEEANKTMGALITRLSTETCLAEARAINKGAESDEVIRRVFEVLAKLAATELMYDKDVLVAMVKFGSHVDNAQIAKTLTTK